MDLNVIAHDFWLISSRNLILLWKCISLKVSMLPSKAMRMSPSLHLLHLRITHYFYFDLETEKFIMKPSQNTCPTINKQLMEINKNGAFWPKIDSIKLFHLRFQSIISNFQVLPGSFLLLLNVYLVSSFCRTIVLLLV